MDNALTIDQTVLPPSSSPTQLTTPEEELGQDRVTQLSAENTFVLPPTPLSPMPPRNDQDAYDEEASVEAKNEETTDAKQEGTTETKQEETTDTTQEETVETKGEETTDTKQEETTDTKQEETVETKGEETEETKLIAASAALLQMLSVSFEKDTERVHSFWKGVTFKLALLVISILIYIYGSIALLKRHLPMQFSWMANAEKNAMGTGNNVQYRSMSDVALAAMNPTLHGFMNTFAVYEDCPQNAADFALHTISFFRTRLTLDHWAGISNGSDMLKRCFPQMDENSGEDRQWEAWIASKEERKVPMTDGTTETWAKNPWYDIFPKDQSSFFAVPIIHEFAHQSDHDDLMLSRLGLLFLSGISGSLVMISYSKPSAQLFHDYWVSDGPPVPASCGGTMERALLAGGSVGMNAGFGASMIGGPPAALVTAGVGMAIGGVTSYFAEKEKCKADRAYQDATE
jgi:hypothetical protein